MGEDQIWGAEKSSWGGENDVEEGARRSRVVGMVQQLAGRTDRAAAVPSALISGKAWDTAMAVQLAEKRGCPNKC